MWMRVLGTEHPNTLTTASESGWLPLAAAMCADAEVIEHEVLGVQGRVLSAEGPSTPMSAVNLASSLSRQGKYAEAEAIENEVLLGKRRDQG